ncbi:MAG: divalent metal cation transporter, partial [Candidatus Aenigmatarchaeota archaeon]
NKKFKEAPKFYWLYTLVIAASAIIIMLPNIPYVPIMVISQVICGILLPFTLIFMLKIVNDRDIMGDYVNTKIFNIIAWVACIIMIILSIFLVLSVISPDLLSVIVPK